MVKKILLGGFLVPLMLASCAPKPLPVVTFNPTATPIHSIVLVTPCIAPQPGLLQGGLNATVDSPAATGVLPFLVVTAIVGGIESHRYEEFDEAVTSHNFDAQTVIVNDLAKALAAKGYAVTIVSATRSKVDYLDSYPLAHADAYLDVVVADYGYGSSSSFKSFTPMLGGKYRVVDAKTNQTLMQNTIMYKGDAADYQFSGASAFGKDPQKTLAGLYEELSEVSTSVAGNL